MPVVYPSPRRRDPTSARPYTQREALLPRLALTATEAPAALGVLHDFFEEHIGPDLRWVRRGSKKRVSVRELERWLDENAARVFGEAL